MIHTTQRAAFAATIAMALSACATPAGSSAADTSDVSVAADTAKEVGVDTADPGPVDTKGFEDIQADTAKPDATAEVGPADAVADAASPPDADVGGGDATPAECPAGQFKKGTPDTTATCVDATCANMSAAVQAAIAYDQAKYEQGCTADDQCTVAPTSTACGGTCGIAVLKTMVTTLASGIAALDTKICKAFDYGAKCGMSTPGCMAKNVGCEGGKCVYSKTATTKCGVPQPTNTVCEGTLWVCKPGYFKGYGGGECLEATCDNLSKAKNDAIESIANKAKVCTPGEECAVVATSTDCGGTCGVAVNAGMSNDVLKIVGWVDENLCKKYEFKTKCGFSTPKCMAPKPGCNQGSCWYNDTVP